MTIMQFFCDIKLVIYYISKVLVTNFVNLDDTVSLRTSNSFSYHLMTETYSLPNSSKPP